MSRHTTTASLPTSAGSWLWVLLGISTEPAVGSAPAGRCETSPTSLRCGTLVSRLKDLIPLQARRRARHTRGMKPFEDRVDAGRQLAQRLESFRGQDVVVLGLPRGGVPVAFEVAKALRAPLDVLVVRKLGVPFQPELAFGAIGEGGEVRVINDAIVRDAGLSRDDIDAVESEQRAQLQRRLDRFRGGRGRISLTGRIAVIVDDGIATGATAKAACQVARAQGASRVVLAVPIGPDDIVERFVGYADDVVCLQDARVLLCGRAGLPQLHPDLRRRGDRAARSRPRRFSGGRCQHECRRPAAAR